MEGRVVGATDGDTIKVLDAAKAQHVVRLGGIDAPERAQPFGRAARENLSRLVFDKRVEARCWKVDQYRREVCAVFVAQRDVGLAMVRDGYAWHFKRFAGRAVAAGAGGVLDGRAERDRGEARALEGRAPDSAVGLEAKAEPVIS